MWRWFKKGQHVIPDKQSIGPCSGGVLGSDVRKYSCDTDDILDFIISLTGDPSASSSEN